MNNRPVVIDLFSGCGGMSLGLEAAGFDIAASVEIDPIHSLVHHYNFPYGATICKDISQLSSQKILDEIESKGFSSNIDVLAGSPPCQGYSYMGRRAVEDPRNKLVFEFSRIVSEIRPKYFIFENVPGLSSGKHQKFLDELIENFEENNYSIVKPIKILDASLYGAPQKRKRLILIGYRNDVPKPSYPSTTHSDNQTLLPLTTVSSAISDLSKIPVFIGHDYGISADQLDYSGFRTSFDVQPKGEYFLCHKRSHNKIVWGHRGSKHTEKSIQRFANTIPGKLDKVSRFLKLSSSGVSNTLRAGTASNKGAFTAPRPIHYQVPRCISIREAARLHTFPDWFQFHRTIWHGFREIGNAVVPIFAKSLGTEIIKCLNIDLSQIEIRKLQLVDDSILSYNMRQASEFWQVPSDVIPKRKRVKV
ncbi:MAG: DNA cytosine methyltransferase [Xenococcaceae cyanobacterium MO_188.B19]|nr:DNA cytosine methyltransferase [Xenococcaceae cyanobacterium MO_188.B19]